MWTFSQFDAISPVRLGVSVGCVWAPPRTGSVDLITGGDSAGEVFSEYTLLGTFNLVDSLIFPSLASHTPLVKTEGSGVRVYIELFLRNAIRSLV